MSEQKNNLTVLDQYPASRKIEPKRDSYQSLYTVVPAKTVAPGTIFSHQRKLTVV
ncbi:MAG: hypothetical protein F6K31_23985 [Symploca sp. SIO2G7]|nr:hypothetical protein [Symploca sp. SIO2G7]